MPIDRCGTCRFWRALTTGQGECRRNAPAAWVSPATVDPPRAVWPLTLAGHGCGQYGPHPLQQPTEQDRELARLREENAELHGEVARLSRAVVDGEGDEED